jgi:autoinducer 2 (AI-2) kinase
MSASYLMALDAGGGGGHCLLVDPESGEVIRAFRPWVHPPAPSTGGLGCDLDLDRIWSALAEAAREAVERAAVTPDHILGIAATSMRLATVILDASGSPVFAVPNRDGRAVAEAFLLAEQGDEIYKRTGHWPNPVFTAARLGWLAANDPAAWERAAVTLSLSDWVAYRLSGELSTEPSQAGETLLFDIASRDWAWDLIDRLQIPRRLFPAVRPCGSRLGSLTREAAEALGLKVGTPVALGGGDTQCGLLGSGVAAPGEAGVVAGTTVPIELVLDRAVIDEKQRLWTGCHVVEGLSVLESNGGGMGEALAWLASILYANGANPVAHFFAEASLSEPGAAGILSTIGAEVMNARELRVPLGHITLSHLSTAHAPNRRRHLTRAVVDGMAYAIRANLEQLCEVAGVTPNALALGGGMSRSDVFAQVISDVANLPVAVGATGEATGLGAAFCAGVGAGVYRDLTEAARTVKAHTRTLRPDPQRVEAYLELYAGWQRLRAARAEADSVAMQLILPTVLRAMNEASNAPARALRPKILVTADMDEKGLGRLRELGEVEYASFRQAMRLLSGDTLVEALRGVQVFVTEIDIVNAEALEKLPDLRVVAACRGDAVNVDFAACSAFGIPVLNAPGRNADAVADLTIAFMLILLRKFPAASAFLRQPGMEPGDIGRMGQAFTALQGHELWNKTVGLVGLGSVGRAVAKRLVSFGAKVLVADPYLKSEQAFLVGAELVSLDELLEASDIVSLHAPATDETKGMISAVRLVRMKTGAFLINTARAALVDEDALAQALKDGHLAGAALDVFSVEPPGSDHPLLALDNVIATPHVGGNTVEVAGHQGEIIAEDLDRLLRGQRPRHVVNAEVLADFDWSKPRRKPDPGVLAQLAARPAPAVSDLQRDRARRPAKAEKAPPEAAAAAQVKREVPPEIADRMGRILKGFVERIAKEPALQRAAADKDVTLHFTLPDLAQSFYFRLAKGKATAGLGEPDAEPDVELRMRAQILDGMFMGTVNAMQAAMQGRLSFSGDTVKAMTLQAVQEDLSRLYRAARGEVGDPGDLASLPEGNGAGAPPVRPVVAGDIREDLIHVVQELYAQELITATGGNVSARIPGTENEIWITPGQLFKGDLRPEILVRIDLDGHPLDPGAPSPSSERLMHCAVYKARSDAQAVVHAHAPHATILANAGLPFLPISTEAAFFGEIPRVPFIMPGTEELAKAVGEGMRDSWAVLMRNHGLIVAGRSLRRAADMVEIIDRTAEVILGCYAVGKKPPTLPKKIVESLQKMGDLMA